VHRLLGHIEIAEEADERGEHTTGLDPVDVVNEPTDVVRRVRRFSRIVCVRY
jgi:hypothetical protein